MSVSAGPPSRTLLLGMGNPYLCDDSIGVRLAGDIHCRLKDRPGLEVIEECSVGGLNLMDRLVGFERVVVLDSIQTRGGVAGAWYAFTAERLRETLHLSNIHDANFVTALELGRRLGHALPADDQIHIFAVEVQDNLTFSERMTDGLEALYPKLLEEIGERVEELLLSP